MTGGDGGGGGGGYQEPPTGTEQNHHHQQQKKQKQEGDSRENDRLNAPPSNDLKSGMPCLTCGCLGASTSIYTRVGNAEALLTLLALALRQPVGSVMLPSYVVCSECHDHFKLIHRLMSRLARLARKTVLGYNKTLRSLGKKVDEDVEKEERKEEEECLLVMDGLDVKVKESGIVGRALAMGMSAAKTTTEPKKAKERKFECPVCGKKFRAYSHRVEHMLVHTGERAFHCAECGFQTATKSNLTRHKQRHKEEIRCQLCGKTLGNKFSLKEHLRTHSKDRPHQCKHCPKTFLRRRELRVHERGHGGVGTQNHECPECHKTFVLRSRLARHLLIHKDEKEFICETCDKKFVRKDDLKCHQRTHTGEKPYRCEECGRVFRYMSNCRSHMKVHLRASLTCHTCNMSFPTQGRYATHLKSRKHRKKCTEEEEVEEEEEEEVVGEEVMVGGMDEVSCGVCGITFNTLEQLSTHTLSTHITPSILPTPPDTSIIISGGVGGGVDGGEGVGVMSLEGVSVVVAVGGGESTPLPLTLPQPSPPSSALLVGGEGPPPASPTFPFTLDSKVGEGVEGVEGVGGTILNSFTDGEEMAACRREGEEEEEEEDKLQHPSIISIPITTTSASSSSSSTNITTTTATTTTTTTTSTPQKVTVFKLSEWEPNEYYEK